MVVSGFVSSFVLSHSSMSPLESPLLLHALWIPIIRNPPMPLDFQYKEPLALGIPNSHPWYRYGYFVLTWPYTFFFNFWRLWDFYPPGCVSVFSGTTVILLIDILTKRLFERQIHTLLLTLLEINDYICTYYVVFISMIHNYSFIVSISNFDCIYYACKFPFSWLFSSLSLPIASFIHCTYFHIF